MLNQEFRPGDQLVKPKSDESELTLTSARYLEYQGVRTVSGEKKILLINRSNQPLNLRVFGGSGAKVISVDATTRSRPPAEERLESEQLQFRAYAVAVLVLKP